ncbi:MAG: 4Fe-4S ferredoxin [Gammaproteobacteria bacterium RIFOXYA12_FULL_61_12]|nr:MAG: 4Fe-4S ferredoxin [Gammaproteobacteria bacterium RIFOXYD12_FULL_61_37]OGT94432.1 MAG: 4Fe-4S ferredoxin [Gammaproteobacteria bacterium RIFOXYA12_FULL_61_12]
MSKSKGQTDMDRRTFMGLTVGAAATLVAPGVFLHSIAQAGDREQPVTDKVRWGMLVDTSKCANGCSACVDACKTENGLSNHGRPATDPTWIRKVKVRDNFTGRETNLPLMCQHCEFPPCVDVCPTGASFKRADGIVMVDRHVCIGCRYCMMACPYKARSFIHEDIEIKPTNAPRGKGCVESCNLCVHRLDNGQAMTACAEACAKAGHNALVFGDLKDPNSPVSQALKQLPSRQIRADLQLSTGVRYSGI